MSESVVEVTTVECNVQNSEPSFWFEFPELEKTSGIDFPEQLRKAQLQNLQLKRELESVRGQKIFEYQEKSKVTSRLNTLLDILPGGVVVLDLNGVVCECNPVASDLLGEPLEGESWMTIIDRCFSPRSDDGHEISLKDGRRVSLSTRSMGNGEGQMILLIDQTDTRNLQAKVSRNDRLSAMGQMVSALAHQIRTPLSAAMLYAGNLCQGSLNQDQSQRFANKLLSRLNHMEQQIRDMLVFAKGDLPLTDRILVSEIIEDIHQAMEVPLLSHDADCTWSFPQNEEVKNKSIFCNRHALVGAVLNLVNNGIQSVTPDKKANLMMTVSMGAINGEDSVTITVQDNGKGMDDDQLQAIENAFYSTKSDGTGLGLYVVQAIAKSHQGEFSMQSKVGQGSTASLSIPCAEI